MIRKTLAFTLIELLVSISIIAAMVSILLPALGAARAQARDLRCLSNLRSHGEMTQIYLNSHEERFPTRVSGPQSGGGSVYGAFMPQRLILRFETRPLDVLTCPEDTAPIRDYAAGEPDGRDPNSLGVADLYNVSPQKVIRYSYGINNMTGIPPETEEERILFNPSAAAYPQPVRTLLYADCTWPNARGHDKAINDAPKLKGRVANAGAPLRLDKLADIPTEYGSPQPRWSRHRRGSNVIFMDHHAELISQKNCFDRILYSWTEK